MSVLLMNEPCPKCKGDKMPFDVYCDNCYEFSIEVKVGRKLIMTSILILLGYKYSEYLQKGDGSHWSQDRFMLRIEAPRQDEKPLIQLLIEDNNNEQKSTT